MDRTFLGYRYLKDSLSEELMRLGGGAVWSLSAWWVLKFIWQSTTNWLKEHWVNDPLCFTYILLYNNSPPKISDYNNENVLFLIILQSGLSSVGRFLCFIRYLLALERSRWLLYPHVWGYHLSWGLVQHLSLWPLQCGWISLSDSLWFQSSFEQHKAQFMRACITSWNKSRGSLGNASVTVSHTWSREKLWVPS